MRDPLPWPQSPDAVLRITRAAAINFLATKQPNKIPSKPQGSKTKQARSLMRAAGPASSSVPRSIAMTLIPPRTKFSLPWTENIALDTSATAYTTGGATTINLSDCTVPFATNATHQPYGFDQLAAFYRRFRIDHVDVEMTIIAGGYGTTVTHATRAFVQWQPPGYNYSMASVANGINVLTERQSIDSWSLFSNTAKGIVSWKKRISMAALCGVTNEEFRANTTLYAGLFPSTAPTRFASMSFTAASETVTPITHSFVISLVYHGEAYERIDYASS